ncbi:hypothetical protein [Ranid herpesvirus 3]|uniref:Uncharacterized protein n=1 Tax=Ranid herpesvirus 3 TaxID=1987509 RepID=A0A1X9T5I8_9VIRU|nr:hypothetical protein [Ranid herpesvirus 3]ARR28969.1 hypothetical protein [Ranid herpesvirus 3]
MNAAVDLINLRGVYPIQATCLQPLYYTHYLSAYNSTSFYSYTPLTTSCPIKLQIGCKEYGACYDPSLLGTLSTDYATCKDVTTLASHAPIVGIYMNELTLAIEKDVDLGYDPVRSDTFINNIQGTVLGAHCIRLMLGLGRVLDMVDCMAYFLFVSYFYGLCDHQLLRDQQNYYYSGSADCPQFATTGLHSRSTFYFITPRGDSSRPYYRVRTSTGYEGSVYEGRWLDIGVPTPATCSSGFIDYTKSSHAHQCPFITDSQRVNYIVARILGAKISSTCPFPCADMDNIFVGILTHQTTDWVNNYMVARGYCSSGGTLNNTCSITTPPFVCMTTGIARHILGCSALDATVMINVMNPAISTSSIEDRLNNLPSTMLFNVWAVQNALCQFTNLMEPSIGKCVAGTVDAFKCLSANKFFLLLANEECNGFMGTYIERFQLPYTIDDIYRASLNAVGFLNLFPAGLYCLEKPNVDAPIVPFPSAVTPTKSTVTAGPIVRPQTSPATSKTAKPLLTLPPLKSTTADPRLYPQANGPFSEDQFCYVNRYNPEYPSSTITTPAYIHHETQLYRQPYRECAINYQVTAFSQYQPCFNPSIMRVLPDNDYVCAKSLADRSWDESFRTALMEFTDAYRLDFRNGNIYEIGPLTQLHQSHNIFHTTLGKRFTSVVRSFTMPMIGEDRYYTVMNCVQYVYFMAHVYGACDPLALPFAQDELLTESEKTCFKKKSYGLWYSSKTYDRPNLYNVPEIDSQYYFFTYQLYGYSEFQTDTSEHTEFLAQYPYLASFLTYPRSTVSWDYISKAGEFNQQIANTAVIYLHEYDYNRYGTTRHGGYPKSLISLITKEQYKAYIASTFWKELQPCTYPCDEYDKAWAFLYLPFQLDYVNNRLANLGLSRC